MVKWLLVGASAAALASGLAMSASPPSNGGPLCRRAPALEQLGAEQAPRQAQTQRARDEAGAPPEIRAERGGDDDDASDEMPAPVVMPAPPPVPAYEPPPAAPPAPMASDVVVTGSAAARATTAPKSGPTAAMPDSVGERVEVRMQPPAGLLTAGDHDELLNPLLYARYVRDAARNLGQSIRDLPRLDTRNVLTVEVEDQAGRSAPFIPVKVKCADGNVLTLTTQADGKVVFFPALDRLGERVTIEAGGASRRVDLAGSGGQTQRLVVGGGAQGVRKLDLMIALDVTGSMGDEISFLQSELRAILDAVRASHPGLDLRVGLVAYRDIGDDFVTRTFPLTGDFGRIQDALALQRGRGGGDTPEAMDQALNRAVNQAWRPDAIKSLLLVADAPPHDDQVARTFAVAEAARARRIHIVPVAASGVDESAQYLMRAMAAATQSRYVFLTDDSGIGNPHAEPAVDCYVVTQLTSAIRRVLDSQLSGERVEPMPGEVIRVTGHYDHGRCVIPKGWQVD